MKIGQRVVCVNAGPMGPMKNVPCPVVLGREYAVGGLKTCPQCGLVVIDVGVRQKGVSLCACGYLANDGDTWWISASRFAPLEERGDVMVEDVINVLQEVRK